MRLLSNPSAFRDLNQLPGLSEWEASINGGLMSQSAAPYMASTVRGSLPPHSSHPALPRLTMLVFEAVLEVVCVSLPGYIIARQGMFTAEMQKFTANLNVTLFTPCLIFTKLASQLTANKLAELAIIPIIFVVQTFVSYLCSRVVSKMFGFGKKQRNFVIAMGVFGNSNSLPISLVLSLSQTIKGLHWDKVMGDNDDEVAARGILYLLIFQQLGQLVRWSWGYNVLLAPLNIQKTDPENVSSQLERGYARSSDEVQRLIDDSVDENGDECDLSGSDETRVEGGRPPKASSTVSYATPNVLSGEEPIILHESQHSSTSSNNSLKGGMLTARLPPALLPTPTNGNIKPTGNITSFPSIGSGTESGDDHIPQGISGAPMRCKLAIGNFLRSWSNRFSHSFNSIFQRLPGTIQQGFRKISGELRRFSIGLWSFMNPPLWAMLAAIIVASIPRLQQFFFADGTFFKNSVTSAINQSGGVAVPLILVVLGGNLARNTLPKEQITEEDNREETKLLIASIISRMLLPIIIMAPLLAVTAKFVPVSILDDPIFVIVCFLITGAPSALQLAQICQINNVYMGAMSRLLFQSYVVWILPSTLVLVMCALEVVEWAQR